MSWRGTSLDGRIVSTIVVADDSPTGRDLLLSLLGYAGHRVLAAEDGAGALDLVHTWHPDLVIADVLMPTMDGFEFVRQLRDDPAIAATPVIFYTAEFHEYEARALAQRCGVLHLLTKPTEPDVLLATVASALGRPTVVPAPELPPDFQERHLRLVSDRLVLSAHEVEDASERLAALVDFGIRLFRETNPDRVLEMACTTARELTRAASAFIETEHEQSQHVDRADAMRVSLSSPSQTYGSIVVTPSGNAKFTAEDERFLTMLATQTALRYENALKAHELAQAVRARDEFLSIAAHELKTPITSLVGYAQLLGAVANGRAPSDPEREGRALQRLEQQALKLSRLVTQLMDVSSLQAGKLHLNVSDVNLSALVRLVATNLRDEGYNVADDAIQNIHLRADAVRLEQIVSNLVQNAVRYTPRGTLIEVGVGFSSSAGFVEISVRDHGPGIPPAKRAHIFDRFYQAHADNHASGMGLGLYISQQIARLHGGRITAEFPEDGGSRFVVTLPV